MKKQKDLAYYSITYLGIPLSFTEYNIKNMAHFMFNDGYTIEEILNYIQELKQTQQTK